VSDPDDRFERETGAVADRVLEDETEWRIHEMRACGPLARR